MGQRARVLTGNLSLEWGAREGGDLSESATGKRVVPIQRYAMVRETKVVQVLERRSVRRCCRCTEKYCGRSTSRWGGRSVRRRAAT